MIVMAISQFLRVIHTTELAEPEKLRDLLLLVISILSSQVAHAAAIVEANKQRDDGRQSNLLPRNHDIDKTGRVLQAKQMPEPQVEGDGNEGDDNEDDDGEYDSDEDEESE
jgi:hypothetical protein